MRKRGATFAVLGAMLAIVSPGGGVALADITVDCSGVKLEKGCHSKDKGAYAFKGPCKIGGLQVWVEIAGSWDDKTKRANENIAVTGKGHIATVALCTDDPWVTKVSCVLTAHSNTTGLGAFSAQQNAPNLFPLTRDTVMGQRVAPVKGEGGFQQQSMHVPECTGGPSAPPPPHTQKPQTFSGPVAASSRPRDSGTVQEATRQSAAVIPGPPTIVQPSDGRQIPRGGTVTVQIAPAPSSSSQEFTLKFERFKPDQRQWEDATPQLSAYTRATAAQIQIPASAFPGKGQWRVSARSSSPSSGWSQPRTFELN